MNTPDITHLKSTVLTQSPLLQNVSIFQVIADSKPVIDNLSNPQECMLLTALSRKTARPTNTGGNSLPSYTASTTSTTNDARVAISASTQARPRAKPFLVHSLKNTNNDITRLLFTREVDSPHPRYSSQAMPGRGGPKRQVGGCLATDFSDRTIEYVEVTDKPRRISAWT